MYRWLHLAANDTAGQTKFNRMLYEMSCSPGVIGAAGTVASPNDPIFWVVHGIFERAFTVLTTAPRYADTYNMTWEGAGCGGSLWKDTLPFRNLFDDAEAADDGGELSTDGTGGYTNKELWDLLAATSEARPYVYDQFTRWGDLDWDPFMPPPAAAAAALPPASDDNDDDSRRERARA